MMRRVWVVLFLAAAGLMIAAGFPAAGVAQKPVVRAVLFWADGCSHCHEVMDKTLPPLQLKYGGQLEIAMIEVSGKANYDYFRQIEDAAKLPAERRGVPALFIADRILVGSQEIPKELPGLIQKHLAAGGVDYPALPGLAERIGPTVDAPLDCALTTPCPTATPQSVALASASLRSAGRGADASSPPPADASQGFELATAVAILLVLSILYVLVALVLAGAGRTIPTLPASAEWLIPALCVIGFGVAGYLTFIETQNVKAICGPVGDCNSVQASPYAKLFGVVPVGVLGLAGYIGIVAAWVLGRRSESLVGVYAPVILLAMALFGVLFSLYLTYIELYVILAVCIWCLTSAVLMALILILSVGPALAVFQDDEPEPSP
jgi:uncharacterized membrane protein/thiol-disulfide isomerase/thioredoxin